MFKRSIPDYKKILEYGFKLKDNLYTYSKEFFNNSFKAIITIDTNNKVAGEVIDLETNEAYLSLRVKVQNGEYVGKVRDEYISILKDIKEKCFISRYFIFNQTNRISNKINELYNVKPEFLWEDTPGCGVFRRKDSNKWFGIIMNVGKNKVDKKDNQDEVEVMNIKLDEDEIIKLLNLKGFYPAYHMNKKKWISIILDDTLDDEEIIKLVNESYNNVK